MTKDWMLSLWEEERDKNIYSYQNWTEAVRQKITNVG